MVADAPSSRARQGELLGGKYVLEQKLGAGGMGEVWRARNVALGREVAIKVLRSEYAENAGITARFLREARTANLVRHPNVIDVLDIGQDESGAPFLVQELLVGQDLGEHVKAAPGGKLTVEEAMRILLPVVDAVAFAHAKGVVHRDLKPENVFLARESEKVVPKLLDFGISQIATGPRLTASGVTLGTPAYMAPEQIKGARDLDARCDIWALGVMIHEIVAGKLPFDAETSADMFVQIATKDPVPLDEAAPGAPPELARIVTRCLSRAPEDRYADAGALAVDLRAMSDAPASRSAGPLRFYAASAARPAVAGVSPQARTKDRTRALGKGAAAKPHAPTVPAIDADRGAPLRFGMVDLTAVPDAAPLQVDPNPPAARAPRKASSWRPAGDDLDAGRLLTGMLLAVAALVGGGLLTMTNPWPEGWAFGRWIGSLLSSSPVPPSGSTAEMVSAAAPWVAAALAAGTAFVAVRQATDTWLSRWRGSAVLLVVVASAALFAAAQLVRGVS